MDKWKSYGIIRLIIDECVKLYRESDCKTLPYMTRIGVFNLNLAYNEYRPTMT